MSWKFLSRLALAVTLISPAGFAHANFIGKSASYPACTGASNFVPGKYKVVSKDGPNGIINVTRKKGGVYQATGVQDLSDFKLCPLGGRSYVMRAKEKDSNRYVYVLVDRTKSGGIIAYDTIYPATYMLNRLVDGVPDPLTDMLPSQAANVKLFKRLSAGSRKKYPVMFTATPVK